MAKKNRRSASREEKEQDKGYVTMEAEVLSCLKGIQFLVKTEKGSEAICHLSGKIRSRRTITPGDKVIVELSSYDFSRGRIVWRIEEKRQAPTIVTPRKSKEIQDTQEES